jgi:hypothetical protein
MRTKILLPVLLVLVSMASAEGSGTLRVYSALELLPVENNRNEKGQKIPDEFVPALHEDLLYAIVAQHHFPQVGDYTDKAAAPNDANKTLQMKVRITGYSGAQNNARVTAEVSFIDKQSGSVLLTKKVTAQLYYDQGAFSSALRKLVRSIGNVVDENW